MESIPKALQEAAEIDGAGIIKVFFKVVLPICVPILATVAIFAAVAQWNNYQDTLIYITDQKLYSLQYLLYTYINQANSLAAMVKQSTGAAMNAVALASQQTPTSIRMTVYSLQYLLYTYINQANSLAAMVKQSTGAAMNAVALASQQTPTSIRMTVSVIVVLPILFIYPMFQRYFVKGIMIGSVKG